MQMSVMKKAPLLALVAVIMTAGSAIAEKKTYDSITDLPKGIQKQINEKDRTFNDNSKWGKVIDGFTCKSNCGGSEGGSFSEAQKADVCSTDLDDEAMRICLGLPPVKKAVRVKKVKVELGSAQ